MLSQTIKPSQITLIDAPNGKLEIDAIWQDSDTVAIICHPNPMQGGTMNNKVVSTLFRYCRDAGMSVLRFNFRGVGASTGTTGNGEGEFIDGLTALRYALAQTGATRVWLGGFSFGGFITCRLAHAVSNDEEFAGLQLAGVALIAPSIVRHDTSQLTWQEDSTCLIYGQHDELVAPLALARFGEHRQIPTSVIDTGHFFHSKLVELRHALETYFGKCDEQG